MLFKVQDQESRASLKRRSIARIKLKNQTQDVNSKLKESIK